MNARGPLQPHGLGARAQGVDLLLHGRALRLGDVARLVRGGEDPKSYVMRYQGRPVIGLGVAMARDGNIEAMGKGLGTAMASIRAELPLGVDVEQVADQPQVVERSFKEFVRSLGEALIIVLAVSCWGCAPALSSRSASRSSWRSRSSRWTCSASTSSALPSAP